jgi:putative DNA primase/helicase
MSADGSFSFPGAPSPDELAAFDLNDYGNAMRLIRLVGGEIDAEGAIDVGRATLLYQLGLGWVGFNGRFWDRRFGEQLAVRTAHAVAQKLRGLFKALVERGTPAKDAMRFIEGAGQAGSTSAMLRQAQAYLSVEIDAFDRDPYALNFRNGTLRLVGAGGRFAARLDEHDPGDRITRLIDIDYDPAAAAPLFRKVVDESLPDPELRAFTQRALGYGSTGATHEQAMFICQGLGRDGKSTILDACRETLGGYGAVGSVATFLEVGQRGGGEAAPDIVKLAGDVRLVILSEPPRGAKLNEGLLKAWTSGSPIMARELREKPFDFRPAGKLFMECNAFPVARGDDDGVWRRIYPILFEHQVPKDQVDRLLPQKLATERAGILNWLIEGVAAWLEHGLDPPAKVTKALEDYRKQSSPFGDWLNERCVWGEAAAGERTLSKTLFDDYKEWAEGQGIDRPMSVRAFGDALHQRQIMLAGRNGAGHKYRGPIRLKSALEIAETIERENVAREAPAGVGGAAAMLPGGAPAAGSPGDPGEIEHYPDDDVDFEGR